MIKFDTSVKKIKNFSVIYSVRIDGQLFYVGLCSLHDFPSLADATRNSQWAAMIKPDQLINVTIETITFDPMWAASKQTEMIETLKPYANKNGQTLPPGAVSGKGAIQCLTTGETFANAAEACRAHDLSPAALSKHLSGSDSYNSVRGNRYKRLT